MRAAIYVRDNRMENEEDSVEDQLRECRTYANHRGWDVVEVYKDLGDGCIEWGRRDELELLLEDAKAGAFDVVIVAEIACISLCFFELYHCFKAFAHNNIEVISTRKFVRGLLYPPQQCYADYFKRESPF